MKIGINKIIMIELRHVVDSRTVNGKLVNICRNFFVYDKPKDYFKNTHKEFSHDEKKIAKRLHNEGY